MGVGALTQLAVTHAHTPSAVRPFFLTFRGTTYVNPKEAGALVALDCLTWCI